MRDKIEVYHVYLHAIPPPRPSITKQYCKYSVCFQPILYMQSIKQVLFFSPSPSPCMVEFYQININNTERKSHGRSLTGPTILGQEDPKLNAQVDYFPVAYPCSTMEGSCLLCWHVLAKRTFHRYTELEYNLE